MGQFLCSNFKTQTDEEIFTFLVNTLLPYLEILSDFQNLRFWKRPLISKRTRVRGKGVRRRQKRRRRNREKEQDDKEEDEEGGGLIH